MLGSGRIFPVSEESIAIEHRDFPDHWPRIGGMDFGWDHPFAAVELVWDRDSDTVYVSKTHRLREATSVIHAAAIRSWGELPWAWPRDGRRETLEGAGVALANQYNEEGLDMCGIHAQFEDGSVSVEAGLLQMLTRMQTGKLKVFKTPERFLGGIPFVPTQRREGRQRGRRLDGCDKIRDHDVALCALPEGYQGHALHLSRRQFWMAM